MFYYLLGNYGNYYIISSKAENDPNLTQISKKEFKQLSKHWIVVYFKDMDKNYSEYYNNWENLERDILIFELAGLK